MKFQQRVFERIAEDFSRAEQAAVIELLNTYAGPEMGRVKWDILELSKGSLAKVKQYVQAAKTDYRDVLYWAEYHDRDPMLRGRDPKKLVDDIVAKWGKKD